MMTEFTEFPIPAEVVDIQETPKAAALPRARVGAPHIARGWIDPVAAVPPGSVLSIPDYLPIPDGWWPWAAPADGFQKICNWTPEALRTGNTDVRDLTIDPKHLFTDTDGLIPVADPGATVAAHRDSQGRVEATQATSAARPVFGRRPFAGIRNRLPDNSTDGAAVGVRNAGGALPSYMFATNLDPSAWEILSIAPKNGLPCVRVRLNGTPTGTVVIGFVGAADAPASSQGQTWTSSLLCQLVGGDLTNVTSTSIRLTEVDASNTTIENTVANFAAAISDNARRTVTRTLTNANTVRSRFSLDLGNTGPIDLTLDIQVGQHEQAAEASAVQVVRQNGFDVTEAGQRDVFYLKPDGVDDFMALAANFEPAGSYTYAIAVNHTSGDSDPHFGSTAGLARFGPGGGVSFAMWANGSGNRTTGASQSYGRQVYLGRWSGAGAAAIWRGGNLMTPTLEGAMSPLAAGGMNRLFAAGSVFAKGRFYGGVLIDRALTEAERQMLQLYLAAKAGVTLT